MQINIVALLLATSLASCQKTPSGDPTPITPGPLKKITLSYTTQPESTLLHVAVAKGYFTEEGLETTSVIFPFGKPALQQVLENKADFSAAAETPFMFSVLKGEKLFVIANIDQTSTNNAIVARRDAGISERGELAGKRIGFTPGTTGDFFLDSMLTVKGIARSDIQPVPLKPDEMLEAILTKNVDAVSIWNYPLALIQQQLGANGVSLVDRHIYTETYNVMAQQKFVQENPETVKSFLRALIKAESFVKQHKDEAQALYSKATNIDLNLVRSVWGEFSYHVNLDNTLIITLEDETRWAIKNKFTDKVVVPDYRNYIHVDSLKAVSPNTVTFNH